MCALNGTFDKGLWTYLVQKDEVFTISEAAKAIKADPVLLGTSVDFIGSNMSNRVQVVSCATSLPWDISKRSVPIPMSSPTSLDQCPFQSLVQAIHACELTLVHDGSVKY